MAASGWEHKMYGSVTVNAKWQIVIPSDARERLGIQSWDQLLVTSKGDIVLWLIKADNVEEFIYKIQQDSPWFFENCRKDVHHLKNHVSGQ